MRSVKFNLILALVLICVSSIGTAQSLSSLNFKVLGGQGGEFPILANELGNAVEYAISDGSVSFMIDPGVSYDNPLFCFDFSDTATVALNAKGASGHLVAMNSVGLASNLSYNLADTISFSPSNSVQCFFQDNTAENPNFGLFGELADNQRSETVDEGLLFNDAFAAFPELDIQYLNLQINSGEILNFVDGAVVSPGDEIAYDVAISNSGNATADQLVFQEVFPADSTMFAASLSIGDWGCVDNSVELGTTAFCPAETGTGPLRFDPADGLQLPPNGTMTFTIIRTVQAGSEGQIRLFAGAVNGSGTTARNAAADPVLDIVGEPVQLEFVQQPTDTTVGQLIDPPVTLEVVDSNGNRVTTDNTTSVALELYQNGTSVDGALASGTTVTNGVVSFGNLDTTGLEVGTGYQIKAKQDAIDPTIGERNSNKFELLQ